MKILLFGRNGQVGWELNRSLIPLGDVVALGREDVDFSNPESLRGIIQSVKPQVIVNAVAYTAVDKAQSDYRLAAIVNGDAPGVLSEEALKLNALLVHYSTDYVFDGTKDTPYSEADEPCPINEYGRTKLAGDQSVSSSGCDYMIFRTSWVYASRGNNFLLTMLRLLQEREEMSIVADQIGSPTTARLIADTTSHCVKQALKEKRDNAFSSDLFHLTAGGYTSWHGFAECIAAIAGNKLALQIKNKKLEKIPTTDFPRPADRPLNSRLQLHKLEEYFDLKMPDWRSALELCLEELA